MLMKIEYLYKYILLDQDKNINKILFFPQQKVS